MYFTDNSRPLLICEHSLDAPARAKYIERLGETVVVNQPGVDGEEPHHQDDVTPVEERRPYLRAAETPLSAENSFTIIRLCIMDESGDSFPPHYWNVSSSAFFPSAPSTRQRDSLPSRARGRRTSQQTERGMWWWCRELADERNIFSAPNFSKAAPNKIYSLQDTVWVLTWAYLAIVPHPVSLHNALKARCELVGSQQGRWSVSAWDAVHKGRYSGITFSL